MNFGRRNTWDRVVEKTNKTILQISLWSAIHQIWAWEALKEVQSLSSSFNNISVTTTGASVSAASGAWVVAPNVLSLSVSGVERRKNARTQFNMASNLTEIKHHLSCTFWASYIESIGTLIDALEIEIEARACNRVSLKNITQLLVYDNDIRCF